MGERAERIGLNHVEHRIDDLCAKQSAHNFLALSAHLLHCHEEDLEQFNGAEAGVSHLLHHLIGLVDIAFFTSVLLHQDNYAVVSNVGEVLSEELMDLALSFICNFLLGVAEFSNDREQELHGVFKLVVAQALAYNLDQALHGDLRGQQVEAVVVLAEVHQD